MNFLEWDDARLEGSDWQGIRYLEIDQSGEGSPARLLIQSIVKINLIA